MDKDVINLPFLLRYLLVHGLIVPRRAPYSAANYKKVWLNEGSPLFVHTQRFAEKLQQSLGSEYHVEIGMRYSDPSIPTALEKFKAVGVEKIILAPMYPQYAEATTESSIKAVKTEINKMKYIIPLKIIKPFFADQGFIQSWKNIMLNFIGESNVDHYLFSFHGLPESHVKKNHGCLLSENCCIEKSACDKPCYRAQCFATAEKIAKSLNLKSSDYSLSFQSRLGREEWLKPSTEKILEQLANAGHKKVVVICPSFVADCIETLEEIAEGAAEVFKSNGGKELLLAPCLNSDAEWVSAFKNILITEQIANR